MKYYWHGMTADNSGVFDGANFDTEAEAIAYLRDPINSEALAESGFERLDLCRIDTVRTVQLQRRVVIVGLDDAPAPAPDAKPRRLRSVRAEPEAAPEPVAQPAPEPAVVELAEVLSEPEPEPTPAEPEPECDTSDRVPRPDVAPWEVIVTGCAVELRIGDDWSHCVYSQPSSAEAVGRKLSAHMESGATGPASVAQRFSAGRAPAAPEL